MIWGTPRAFWLLLLVPVLVALYLHRRRTIFVTVPSLLFWQEFGRPTDGLPLGLVLRNLLNLLVQVALLCLLVLTLANPDPPFRTREHLVLIVDASATMQTQSTSGVSRLQEALQRAEILVSSMPDDGLLTVVRAGAFPQVLLKASPDKTSARAALITIAAADVDSDLHEAAQLAESLHVAGWQTRIACISDFVGVGPMQASNPAVRLSLEQVGHDSPNGGIVGLALADDRLGLQIGIGQSGLTGQRATVSLRAGGQEVARQAVDMLQPLTTVQLAASLPAGTAFSVHLEPTDLLPLDNVAHGVWPDAPRLRVQLVTQANPYLQQALSAEPSALLHVGTPSEWDPASPTDVTVLEGVDPAVVRRTPGKFILFAGRVAGPAPASGPAPSLAATYWTADHPVLRNVDPSLWRIRRSAGMAFDGARVLASAQGVPLVCEWSPLPAKGNGAAVSSSQTQVIVFNFSLADTDLVLRPAFPVVLWDAIGYLTGTDRPEQVVAHRTSSPLKLSAEGKADPPMVTGPDCPAHPMLKQGTEWTWLDTSRQGLYTVRQPDRQRAVAFNWMSLRSSMPHKPLPMAAVVPTQAAHSGWAMYFALPWQMLLGLAMAAAVVEWLLFQWRILDMRQR